MRVIQVANRPRAAGAGGDRAVDRTVRLLRSRGVDVHLETKSSEGLDRSFLRKVITLKESIHSRRSYNSMRRLILDWKPDIVHIHNLYPLFSPSIIGACRDARIPTVMTLHSFFLVCPTTFHYRGTAPCELCCGGREFWCVIKNCRENLLESAAYGLRTAIGRLSRVFEDITLFVALTEFSRSRFLEAGIPAERIEVIPNFAPRHSDTVLRRGDGDYVAFLGRINPEKGCDLFVDAMAMLPEVVGRVAGDGPLLSSLLDKAQKNVEFLGWLQPDQVTPFLGSSRFLVLASRCFEMCPLSVLEAMSLGRPVIAPRIGGLPEIVEDGIDGLLFNPGDRRDLAQKIERLWKDEDLWILLSNGARRKAEGSFSSVTHFDRMMAAYERAIQLKETMR